MSPQIVTETLYALVTEQHFIPTEIRLITTTLGYNRVVRDLLDEQDGQFHAFCREYNLVGKIQFDASSITILSDMQHQPLEDVRTPAENNRAADEISRIVQTLCQDDTAALHVSLSGGRKTMGFFLGYALSLFARSQDKLSHVLVSDPFSDNKDFFFPSKIRRELITPDGHKIDTLDARIMLTEIPLVRLRAGLPNELLMGQASYSATVTAAQARIDPLVELAFDVANCKLICGGIAIRVQPMQLAFMLWMAKLRIAQRPVRPGTDVNVYEFLAVYRTVVSPQSSSYETAQISLKLPEDFLAKCQELRARLKRKLEHQLGKTAKPYLIESFGSQNKKQYQLCLAPEAIRL
jgi:CRISPR-associated protein (TIGR02584 family)